jgi:hypothetical protein
VQLPDFFKSIIANPLHPLNRQAIDNSSDVTVASSQSDRRPGIHEAAPACLSDNFLTQQELRLVSTPHSSFIFTTTFPASSPLLLPSSYPLLTLDY